MNRRVLFPLLAAPLAQAKPKAPSIWDSTPGQYVLMLRAELERLGHFDDLKEDWQAVEQALRDGCQFFEVRPSRMEKATRKALVRVAPVKLWVKYYPGVEASIDEVTYVDTLPWSRG